MVENAVGRRVLVPARLWPKYSCTEHGGEGWEGVISKMRTTRTEPNGSALVDFVARKRSGVKWVPAWLALSDLRPLA